MRITSSSWKDPVRVRNQIVMEHTTPCMDHDTPMDLFVGICAHKQMRCFLFC